MSIQICLIISFRLLLHVNQSFLFIVAEYSFTKHMFFKIVLSILIPLSIYLVRADSSDSLVLFETIEISRNRVEDGS